LNGISTASSSVDDSGTVDNDGAAVEDNGTVSGTVDDDDAAVDNNAALSSTFAYK